MCCKSDRNAKNNGRYCNLSSMNVYKDGLVQSFIPLNIFSPQQFALQVKTRIK